MSEAAGPKLWGFNEATSLLPAADRYRSLATESGSYGDSIKQLRSYQQVIDIVL